jgi:futalosine hydrolase
MSLREDWLVLAPTAHERSRLADPSPWPEAPCIELCGFGPVAAAARTAQLLAERRATRVLLLGLAGSLCPERAPLGSARLFASVRLDGVGAGSGERFVAASDLGFPQWDGGVRVEETLALAGPSDPCELLTVCAAAASPQEAELRRARYPSAVAEDMEGFAVALACRLAGVPLFLVRGFSNLAGERERNSWRSDEALAAARALAATVLATRGASPAGRRS